MRHVILCALLVVLFSMGSAQPEPLSALDTNSAPQTSPPRVYTTARLAGPRPVIDGRLDDQCWTEGEWAGNFVQWIPNEGAKPSQPTWLKLLYDRQSIYVAIRAHDGEPEKIVWNGGRRDQFRGDMVGVTFDSYHDHRTGFEFDVSAAGQKIDLVLTNPSNPDPNWNAVWYVEVAKEDSGWTAEFEIPLSQLRYSSDIEQVWGMHCWRWIDRLQEESDWEPQSSTGPGILFLFGELRGLRGLPTSRQIEVMPFTLGKLNTYPAEAANPFTADGHSWHGNMGFDAKFGISTNFTADLTVNPDFGQVEADPSVMNLTAYETFYEEKRPFFLEGKSIFSFDFDNVNMFYSRRIGHAPNCTPNVSGGAPYLKTPENTTILSALKLSGKTADGLSIGVLQSITNKEYATIATDGGSREIAVEPLTSTTLARLQQDYDGGSTVIGGIITATNRFINDPQLTLINRNAYAGGFDFLHQWNDKEFFVTGKVVGSTISGSPEAMRSLQTSPAHYYQRPDVDYISVDPNRTSLSGYGGQIRIGKGSKGLWRYSTQLDWRSPGMDLNDLGYMQTADIIKSTNAVSYFVNQPVGILRTYTLGLTETSTLDFGGRYLATNVTGSLYSEFLNNWALSVSLSHTPEVLDTRLLRGGPAMKVPAWWEIESRLRSNPSADVVFECEYEVSPARQNGSAWYSVEPSLAVTPVPTLRIAVSAVYTSTLDDLQYVGSGMPAGTMEYYLARIDQQSLGMTFRVDWNMTNTVSVQYYGSPFGSVGRYSGFKRVTDAKAAEYEKRFLIDDAASASNHEDFDFSQFRSVMVFRWEYLPGSQLYLVWSHERTRYEQPGVNSVGGAIRDLSDAVGTNVFLAKLSYWFTI